MNLGETIKNLRKKKGIKQLELAEKCSITQSYLSNIETNRKEPTLGVLNTISNILSVPLPILMFLSMDENDVAEDKKKYFYLFVPTMKENILEIFAL